MSGRRNDAGERALAVDRRAVLLPRAPRVIAVVVALGVGLQLAGVAEEERVRLVVLRDQAAAHCPGDDELADRVRERIGSEPFRDDDDRRGRELRVGIAGDGDGLEARVVLFSPSGSRLGRRALRGGRDCARLADDLVLAIAIAIDPLLLVRRPPERLEDEIAERAPAAAPAIVAPPAAPEDYVEDVPQVRRRALPELALPAPASIVGRAVLLASGGIGVLVTPTARGEISFDYGILDVDLVGRLDLPARYPIEQTGGAALLDLTLLTAQVAPCLGVTWDIVTARGCLVGEAGALVAQGIGFREERSVTIPWVSLGGRGALDFRIWPTFGLVVTGDLSTPLVRPRLVDDVTGEIYARPGPVVGSIGLGLELQIR